VLDAVISRPDGSRLAYVAPTGAGRYMVTVGSPSPTVTATVAQRSTVALAPITEPQARALLESSLRQFEASGDAKVRANAALAPVLLAELLGSGPDPNGSG
jgi:hypothetical protein